MPEQSQPDFVDINYIKSNDFREAACDGALGGPTPQGKLWVAFYTERLPLPRVVRHTLTKSAGSDDLTLSAEGTPLESKQGVVRNIEFGVYLSLETAEQLQTWLGEHISALRVQK